MNTRPIFPKYTIVEEYFDYTGRPIRPINDCAECKISVFSLVRYKYKKIWYKELISRSSMFNFDTCMTFAEKIELIKLRETEILETFIESCYITVNCGYPRLASDQDQTQISEKNRLELKNALQMGVPLNTLI